MYVVQHQSVCFTPEDQIPYEDVCDDPDCDEVQCVFPQCTQQKLLLAYKETLDEEICAEVGCVDLSIAEALGNDQHENLLLFDGQPFHNHSALQLPIGMANVVEVCLDRVVTIHYN